jgi:hypothetical protein
MYKYYCFSIFFSLVLCVKAQQNLPIWHDSTQIKRELVFSAGASMQSSHLRSDFVGKILFGGFVDDDMKIRSIKFLSDKPLNRTGAMASIDLNYADYGINMFGLEQFGLMLLAGHQTYAGATYRSDVYRLLTEGNATAPENIDLTDTRFYSLSHQKLGFGLVDKKTRSSFALSLVNSAGFQNFSLTNGLFNQSPFHDTTNILLLGNYSGNSLGGLSNGIGFAIDLDFRLSIKVADKDAVIQILAQNLGMVRYNRASFDYTLNNSYQYTGFTLDGLQSITQQETFDIADTLNLSKQTGGTNQWLPGLIQVAKIVDRNSEQVFQSFFGVNVYTQIMYLPQVYAGIHWQSNKKYAAGFLGSYGGFGGPRIGMYVDALIGGFRLGISSQDLLGSLTNSGFGNALAVRLVWQQK